MTDEQNIISENVLLSLLFSLKMFEATKICYCFPCSLRVLKDQISLSSHDAKIIKYFYFSCNSIFGTFIFVFPFHRNVVCLFRENFYDLCVFIISVSKSQNIQKKKRKKKKKSIMLWLCHNTFFLFWNLHVCATLQPCYHGQNWLNTVLEEKKKKKKKKKKNIPTIPTFHDWNS